ncbi:helix-turn-helix domain-containing protein [Oceanicella sp. SM1341]|uniref:helix-turn-helix domain-containing protein n=1 Tax=Oceanicella sp. SM1341 TaxID=1548889 RepID=UPI000E5077B6|nr:helix-turn-helix domain-containing protein [Oceanicella sp. SM1341]
MNDRDADLADPAPWAAAERQMPRRLARVAALLARLDERLGGAGAMPARLAEEEAVALARADGARLALEAFLLWRHGAPAGGTAPGALLAAGWAARRLTGAAPEIGAGAAGLRRFLGHDGSETDLALRPLLRRPTGADWDAEAEAWSQEMAGLAALHPLTRGAAALALWHGHGLGGAGAVLEGTVLAARIAAADQARARFLPLGDAPRAAGPGPEARLAAFLERAEARLEPVLAGLARRADWAGLARTRAAALPGRLPLAAAELIAAEHLVSANLLRDRLGVSQQAANAVLRRFEELGLVREMSGQKRYRLWQIRA